MSNGTETNDKNYDSNGVEKIRKTLFTEVRVVWMIVVATLGVAGIFYKLVLDNNNLAGEIKRHRSPAPDSKYQRQRPAYFGIEDWRNIKYPANHFN